MCDFIDEEWERCSFETIIRPDLTSWYEQDLSK
jgi:hypothetical protein